MNAPAERINQRVFTSRVGVETYVTPAGPLVSPDVNQELLNALEACKNNGDTRVVVDLSDVPQINSMTIEVLLDAQDEMLRIGGRLKVTEANTLVFEILQITGFTQRVSTFSKETDEGKDSNHAGGGQQNEPPRKRSKKRCASRLDPVCGSAK
jgi:anti-anti-sigma factor